MDAGAIAKAIGEQFVTAWNAPVPFLAAMIAGWFLIRWHLNGQFSTRLENAQSTLALRDAQLQDYKDKLSGATPDEAKARMDALEARLDQIGPQIAALGPRTVTADQRQRMVPILDAFRGSAIEIASDAASPDAAQMSKGLLAAFNSAAWHVDSAMVMGLGNPPPTGVGLEIDDLARPTPVQQAVADALRAAGIEFDLRTGPSRNRHHLPGRPEPIAQIILTTRLRD